MESYEKLIASIDSNDWDSLNTILKPKDFCGHMPRTLDEFVKLLKVAELLIAEDYDVPEKTKILLLKCLVNSCVNGYKEETHTSQDASPKKNIYKSLSQEVFNWKEDSPYKYSSHFPYDEVVRWVIKTITDLAGDKKRLTEDQGEILRLSLQFLCNFFTFSFNISTSNNADVIMQNVKDDKFKSTIIKLVGHDRAQTARAACAYVHNMFKQVFKEFYATMDKKELTTELIKSTISDIQAALDTITLLLHEPTYLKDIYDEISIDDRLYLLDIIYQEVRSTAYNESIEKSFPVEVFEFLADKFKKKSDLILKTSDKQLNDIEPTEVTIILDILGVLTSNNNLEECKKLQEDKSLLINCIFLLKAIQMIGKESKNCFTPLQNLSDLAISNDDNCCKNENNSETHVCSKNIKSHPAFGFKASLIRVIGNLVYKDEKNQNLLRESDGIALLLDCCNIDARNPLIIQWTTLAIRNLLENNPENQEVVRKSVKVGVVDNAVIKEMGLTLNEDSEGNAISIMPLPKKD